MKEKGKKVCKELKETENHSNPLERLGLRCVLGRPARKNINQDSIIFIQRHLLSIDNGLLILMDMISASSDVYTDNKNY